MIGVDEVGRGALAGPLLVVAARLTGKLSIGLADSKELTRPQRESLFAELIDNFEFGEGWVKSSEIDRLGLGPCLRLGVRRSLAKLDAIPNEEVVMDGSCNYVPKKYKFGRCEVDADANLPIVSAASIYAKVTRDRFMAELSNRHNNFNFSNHVGYGTPQHYEELRVFGPIKNIHRMSFKPVRQVSPL